MGKGLPMRNVLRGLGVEDTTSRRRHVGVSHALQRLASWISREQGTERAVPWQQHFQWTLLRGRPRGRERVVALQCICLGPIQYMRAAAHMAETQKTNICEKLTTYPTPGFFFFFLYESVGEDLARKKHRPETESVDCSISY